jgi:ABC-2 type transport system permease protein
MRRLGVIFRRELAQYFASPIAYFVAFAVLVVAGVLFNSDLALRNGKGDGTDGSLVVTFFALMTLFFAPLLTMRLFAEENREGTIELLMTLPVNDGDIVLGKFLGAWAYYTIILALTLVHQILLIWLTPPDMGAAVSAYIGVWLYGGAAIAVGLLFSALTENQIVAAFMSISVLVILWLADLVGRVINNLAVAEVVRSLSFQNHFMYSFTKGLVRLNDVVFFVGVIVALLFITTRIVESRRWR